MSTAFGIAGGVEDTQRQEPPMLLETARWRLLGRAERPWPGCPPAAAPRVPPTRLWDTMARRGTLGRAAGGESAAA